MSKQFPKGFIWGTSTASYQIEGAAEEDGRGPSIWDTFSHTPGKVANGDTGDVACDHYHRYSEDIALMQRLGISAYRFSTAWPRILPEGKGQINQAGLAFYDRLVDALLAAGISPWLCFYHWDLPQALQDLGGWQNRDIADWFADYAMIVHRRLGDRVRHYATFNEPNVISVLGHALGIHAPGLTDREATFKTIHHINLSHGKTIAALRADKKDLILGIVNNLGPAVPASESEADKKAADYADAVWNRAFADPQFLGRYPALLEEELAPHLKPDDLVTIHQRLDYFGVNHYSPNYIKHDSDAVLGYSNPPPPEGTSVTGMGWEVSPRAFFDQLMDIEKSYGPIPIYVTENGAGYEETASPDDQVHDDDRVAFLEAYLGAMREAIAAGADVRGYFIWSLLDNFEWAFGYAKRFGLVYIDYQTLKRIPKKSFEYYRKVAAANAVLPAAQSEKRASPAMTTIVGIFDNARDLDQAVERLAEAGIEDTVFDEAIVAGEAGNVGPVFGPGSSTSGIIVKPELPSKPDRHAIIRAFKAHLADYHLPEDVIDGYATTFYHKGKFVLVRTDPQRAEQVIQILRGCRASRVNRHG